MSKPIKVIDLFSGPGGLSEGFSSHKNNFKIAISIEKEQSAHRTLVLRAFVRQFSEIPDEYYQFLKGELGKSPADILYTLPKFNKEVQKAYAEARCLTLGQDNQAITDNIDNAIGHEDCILIGGPPCQAYSLAGRSRNMGIENYCSKDDHRNFLYLEYLKVIARYQPKVFVMENVKGLLSAVVEGNSIFASIRNDLENPCEVTEINPQSGRSKHRYQIFSFVTAIDDKANMNEFKNAKGFVIKSENYGIPQKRHRVILFGIRDDIANNWDEQLLLTFHPNKVTVKDVINDLPKLRSGFSKSLNTNDRWVDFLKTSLPNLAYQLSQDGLTEVAEEMDFQASLIDTIPNGQGSLFGQKSISSNLKIQSNTQLQEWIQDERMEGFVTNHETRGHLEKDLHRYFFCSVWANVAKNNAWTSKFPKSRDYSDVLKPNHKNFDTGKFADRFRVQIENDAATTITSHISKDGHYFIHYDPLQCRSLTVREAARIQTFPDNYFFVGNRTEQYVQVGNAVPPYLARQIAKLVDSILNK
jgi:DNA (cytosine-5)-methyltransferase 1